MAWRLARSLVVLRGEVQTVAPGTTFWTLGDEDHQDEWSDHNPNAAGVVCAADILDNAGLDLDWLAATIVATDPPALKYVIWRDRIWFPGIGWDRYFGQYHSHVHVSVGWGPDGRSTGPYDDPSPWGLLSAPSTQEVDMERRVRSGAGEGSIYLVPGWRAPSGLWAAYGLDGPTNDRFGFLPLIQLPAGMSVGAAGLYDVTVGRWDPANPPKPPATLPGSGVDLAPVMAELAALPTRVGAELAERMKA